MQRITQWGEYGVHVCLFIARRHDEGSQIVTATEIADAQHIALNYTQQILVKLRSSSILSSERGPHGGYFLARSPDRINLKDILLSCEGETMDLLCDTKPLDDERCSPEAFCYLRTVWMGLKNEIDSYLESITLDSLLEKLKSGKQDYTTSLVNLPTYINQEKYVPEEK